jgi:hypothetical protein
MSTFDKRVPFVEGREAHTFAQSTDWLGKGSIDVAKLTVFATSQRAVLLQKPKTVHHPYPIG